MLTWIDLETTGLDESAAGAQVLEVGITLTSDDAESVFGHFCQPVFFDRAQDLPARVQEMHGESGLLDDCAQSPYSMTEVEANALAWLTQCSAHPMAPRYRSPVCGKRPDFDRRWIAKHMPKLHGHFHKYRNLDSLMLWLWAKCQGVEFAKPPQTSHRPLQDLEDAIALAKESWSGAGNQTAEQALLSLEAALCNDPNPERHVARLKGLVEVLAPTDSCDLQGPLDG